MSADRIFYRCTDGVMRELVPGRLVRTSDLTLAGLLQMAGGKGSRRLRLIAPSDWPVSQQQFDDALNIARGNVQLEIDALPVTKLEGNDALIVGHTDGFSYVDLPLVVRPLRSTRRSRAHAPKKAAARPSRASSKRSGR